MGDKRTLWDNYEICKLACINNGLALKYVNPELITDELWKLAIKQQTEEILKLDIKQQIGEICKLIIRKNLYLLEYVKKELINEFITDEICKLSHIENG